LSGQVLDGKLDSTGGGIVGLPDSPARATDGAVGWRGSQARARSRAVLTVHHLGHSQSERIVWLCEELGLEYRLRRYAREASGLAPREYKALHPAGTAPVIEDGAVTLAESGAIIDYILSLYGAGALRPRPDQAGFADYLFWFHFANASFMLARLVLAAAPEGGEDNMVVSAFRKRDLQIYAMIEARLSAVPFFAGETFTAADIMMAFPLTTGRRFSPRDFSSYPAIRAYVARIGEREAFRRAMAKAEPGCEPLLD
jgi:glutathione S-transferase